MKGNQKIIDSLNIFLSDELTAINQYMVQSEMCESWGYKQLHDSIEKRAKEEMKHAEKLISRIIFLEGRPEVSKLGKIHVGENVEEQLKNDYESEKEAIRAYNEGIGFASTSGDNGTKELLESILLDEEKHLDQLEMQISQMNQLGVENFLVEQV